MVGHPDGMGCLAAVGAILPRDVPRVKGVASRGCMTVVALVLLLCLSYLKLQAFSASNRVQDFMVRARLDKVATGCVYI